MDNISTPEPPPQNNGQPVTPMLLDWLATHKMIPFSAKASAFLLVKSRSEFGQKKYGQPLMTQDGRDSATDALQELGDLIQYCFKGRLNGEDMTAVRELIPVLAAILHPSSGE